jgi:hypothetical protein
MTTKTEALPEAGTLIHVVEDGLTAFGQVWSRGNQIHLSQSHISQTLDRNGNSWLALVDDEGAQTARWGKVMIRRGPFPDGEPAWRYGDQRWADARAEAHSAAWKLGTEAERSAALKEVTRIYGAARKTSRTITGGR